MALGANALAGALSAALATQHDSFLADEQSTVTIRPAHSRWRNTWRDRLKRLPLAGPVNFNIQANFVAPFDQLTGVLDDANTFLTGGAGVSFRQPWFNYQVWKSTTPLGFTIPLLFVARFNAREEVWWPVLDLLRFTMPMELAGVSLNMGFLEQSMATGTNLLTGVVNAVTGTGIPPITSEQVSQSGSLDGFIPPGPHFLNNLAAAQAPFANVFSALADNIGAAVNRRTATELPVSVRIGNFFWFSRCYVQSVDVTLDPLLDPDGFPLRASVRVELRSMGSPFLDSNGRIRLSSASDGFTEASENIGSFLG